MPFSWDNMPYTNFHELNLDYFINKFNEIFDEWANLYDTLTTWKNTTTTELETWKTQTENNITTWENSVISDLNAWKSTTQTDISSWETATLAALDAWKTATTAIFEAIRTEAAASATAAANSATAAGNARTAAETAQAAAEAAQTAAEAAAASVQASSAQITANANEINKLKEIYSGFILDANDFEKGGLNGSGVNDSYRSGCRCRNINIVSYPFDVNFKVKDGVTNCAFSIHFYNANGTHTSDTGWQTDYTAPADSYYRLAMDGSYQSTESQLTITELLNKIDATSISILSLQDQIDDINKEIVYTNNNIDVLTNPEPALDLSDTIVKGQYSGNVGAELTYGNASNYRCAIPIIYGIKDTSAVITIGTNYHASIRTVNKSDNIITADSGWKTGVVTIDLNENSKYAIIFGKTPETGDAITLANVENNFSVTYNTPLTEQIKNIETENFVNVKYFGAVGDGVTDDTDAIQDAFESVKTSGGTVYIPAGTYLINTYLFDSGNSSRACCLHIYSNTTLLMDKNAKLLKGHDVSRILSIHNESSAVSYSGAENIVIDGGIFDGDNTLAGTDAGMGFVYFTHSQFVTLRNAKFINSAGTWHALECNSSKNVIIDNCIFDVIYHNGAIDIDAANDSGNLGQNDHTVCESIEIKSCYFNTGYRSAIQNHSDYAQHNIRIHDCEFHFTGVQKGVIDFASTVSKVDVYNNTFISNTSEAYAFNMTDEELSSTFHDNRCEMPNITEPYSIYKNCTAYNNIINGTFTA